jgi:hypothetical protein
VLRVYGANRWRTLALLWPPLPPPPTSCDGCEFRAGLPGCSFRLEMPRMLAALVLLALAGMNFSPGALGQEAILRRKGMA